jgi:hypothetical protein
MGIREVSGVCGGVRSMPGFHLYIGALLNGLVYLSWFGSWANLPFFFQEAPEVKEEVSEDSKPAEEEPAEEEEEEEELEDPKEKLEEG